MITQTVTVNNRDTQNIIIGRRGTHDTEQIVFDLSYLINAFGDGTAVLMVKRSKDATAYPATTEQSGTKLYYYTDATAVATADMVRSTLGRPLKIWCAQDDDTVSYNAIDALCKSIRNSGGYAQLRTMPNNTGRHHSVDNAENAPQTTNITTKCGVEYASIATAYYELVQFFDQFLTE